MTVNTAVSLGSRVPTIVRPTATGEIPRPSSLRTKAAGGGSASGVIGGEAGQAARAKAAQIRDETSA